LENTKKKKIAGLVKKINRPRFLFITILAIKILACHYYFGIFAPYNYFTAQLDISNNKIYLIDTGPPNVIEQQVAQSLGFKMVNVIPIRYLF
jgi:hypothetical protein